MNLYQSPKQKGQPKKRLPILKYIIPFVWGNDSYENLISFFDKSDKWKDDQLYNHENEIYEHVRDLINNKVDIKDAIGRAYSYKNANKIKIQVSEDISLNTSFNKINMISFQTNIGFLVMDINADTITNMDEIIALNHEFKSIRSTKDNSITIYDKPFECGMKCDSSITIYDKPHKNTCIEITDTINKNTIYVLKEMFPNNAEDIRLIYNKKNKEKEFKYTIPDNYNLKTFIMKMLTGVEINSFFNQFISKNTVKKINVEDQAEGLPQILPRKANIFSIVLVDQMNDIHELKHAFYRFRKGYKESYLPSKEECEFINNNEIYRPFENSIWGIAREGFVNLAYIVDNKDTNKFFTSNGYVDKMDNYFYLYILILHQYYGLLNLTKEISKLPNKTDTYIEYKNQKDEFQNLIEKRDKINFFYLKCVFEEVSHITHQSVLYEKMEKVLGIEKMINELDLETRRITDIVSQVRQKQTEKREKKTRKFFAIVTGIFAILTVMEAVWNMVKFMELDFLCCTNEALNELFTVICIVLGVSIIVGGVIYLVFLRTDNRNERRKMKR